MIPTYPRYPPGKYNRAATTSQSHQASRSRSACPRRIHDDAHADETDQRADDVVSVGPKAVQRHPPRKGADHEDTAVCSEDAAEVGFLLQRDQEAVQPERNHPSTDPQPAPVLANTLPDQPRTTDFGEGRRDEEGYRTHSVHQVILSARLTFSNDASPRPPHLDSTVGRPRARLMHHLAHSCAARAGQQ